jgi:hypothetical protein
MKFEVDKLPYVLLAIDRDDIKNDLDEQFKDKFEQIDDVELWNIISKVEDMHSDMRAELYMSTCYEVARMVEVSIENMDYPKNIGIKEKKNEQ